MISSLEVFCVVSAYAKTGVEMEAIMGVNAALNNYLRFK